MTHCEWCERAIPWDAHKYDHDDYDHDDLEEATMKLYPNVPCCICDEYVDPTSAFWVTTEDARFDNFGWPYETTDMMPTCEDCTLRILSDKDAPRHAIRRPRPPDSK